MLIALAIGLGRLLFCKTQNGMLTVNYLLIHFLLKYSIRCFSYSLGPNGGILTSLNLFSVHFNQVRASSVGARLSVCLSIKG